MVNVDTVYQRVLALANKEQRGYITPQEFNLFANQAQLEIVDQYFYDKNQFNRVHGNETDYSDMIDLLEEKIGVLEATADSTCGNCLVHELPGNLYHLDIVVDKTYQCELEKVTYKEFLRMNKSPLTKPKGGDRADSVYYHDFGNTIKTHPNTHAKFHYIRKPTKVDWGYVVINKKALYDPGNSRDFDLHPMEETELVYKILGLAGITLNKPGLAQTAVNLELNKVQQEKQ